MSLHLQAEIAQLRTLNKIRRRIMRKPMFQTKPDREHRTCEYCGALWLGVEDRCFNGHSELHVYTWRMAKIMDARIMAAFQGAK